METSNKKSKRNKQNAKPRANRNGRRRLGRRVPNIAAITKLLTNSRVDDPNGNSSIDNVLQPTAFRKYKDKSSLLSSLQQYHSHTRGQYLTALVHPDVAVKNGISAKLPTDLPIPTASIGFHTQHQFTTSALGSFLLTWRPGVFVTQGLLPVGFGFSNLTYNNVTTLNGTTMTTANYFAPMGVYPTVALQRYRVVSALLKVSYNGNVLNQSGTMLACATFDPFNVALNSTTLLATTNDPLVDRFSNFSLIQNGLWNRTVNITKDSEGIEALYVPMDPDDLMFQKVDTYYGDVINTGLNAPDLEGAHINYVVAGRNLPANSSSILVDCYYNFEVIADPSSAYILKSAVDDSYRQCDKAELFNTLKDVAKSGNLLKPSAGNSGGKWTDLLMKAIQMGVQYIPMLLG